MSKTLRLVARTIAIALVLHGCFTVAFPYILYSYSSSIDGFSFDLGLFRFLGLVMFVLGWLLYLWCVAQFIRENVAPLPFHRPSGLVNDGWYGRVRNPILLGVMLIVFGEAVFFENLLLLAYAALYSLTIHLFIVFYEEPGLKSEFGKDFESYCNEVPRWLPRFF